MSHLKTWTSVVPRKKNASAILKKKEVKCHFMNSLYHINLYKS